MTNPDYVAAENRVAMLTATAKAQNEEIAALKAVLAPHDPSEALETLTALLAYEAKRSRNDAPDFT